MLFELCKRAGLITGGSKCGVARIDSYVNPKRVLQQMYKI